MEEKVRRGLDGSPAFRGESVFLEAGVGFVWEGTFDEAMF